MMRDGWGPIKLAMSSQTRFLRAHAATTADSRSLPILMVPLAMIGFRASGRHAAVHLTTFRSRALEHWEFLGLWDVSTSRQLQVLMHVWCKASSCTSDSTLAAD